MPPLVHSRKWSWLVAALALAGTALRVYQWYSARRLWVDEEMMLLNVRDRAMTDLIGPLWLNQAAPLGWLALERFVVTAFGTSDRAVRALPVLFGIGTLWVAFWMAQRWMKPAGAAAFVVLCGFAQWITLYAIEVKPYSADACWALGLPALAIWAVEPVNGRPLSVARTAIWWGVAAVGQWFSFGAAFVTPGCALVLCAIAWRRSGWRLAATIALQGLIWLVSFVPHYVLSIRHARNSEYLREYWASAFPPPGAGLTGTLQWLAKQAEPLAFHPGGTLLWIGFWATVVYGVTVSIVRRPPVGLMVLSVIVSAFVFAAFRYVPFADRLALWMVPALYVAIAVALDDAIERSRAFVAHRNWVTAAVTVAFAVVAVWVCVDIVKRGRDNLIVGGENHGLDDRRAWRFLVTQRQPGDVLIATKLSLPAIWWYGNIPISGADIGSRYPSDAAPIFELKHEWPGAPDCGRLSRSLAGSKRAAVYLGFASNVPTGFQELVLDEFSTIGLLVSYRQISSEGIAAIFDFELPPQPWTSSVARPTGRQLESVKRPAGCATVQPAGRW